MKQFTVLMQASGTFYAEIRGKNIGQVVHLNIGL